jgi:hypothetical protein
MTSGIIMHVYFDKVGNIKVISPTVDENISDLDYCKVSFTEVENFLTGTANTYDFYVSNISKTNIPEYKITKKEIFDKIFLRTIDSYLTQVPQDNITHNAAIIIENFISNKKIRIIINGNFIRLSKSNDIDLTSLITPDLIPLYFTKKNDPYFLLHKLMFSTETLFSKQALFFEYTCELNDVSVFMHKSTDNYYYREI